MKPIERSKSFDFIILREVGINKTVLSRIFTSSIFFLRVKEKLVIKLHSWTKFVLFILHLSLERIYSIILKVHYFLFGAKVKNFFKNPNSPVKFLKSQLCHEV